jgi:hypothetical protein
MDRPFFEHAVIIFTTYVPTAPSYEAVVFYHSADWMPLNNVFLLFTSSGPQRESIIDASVVL